MCLFSLGVQLHVCQFIELFVVRMNARSVGDVQSMLNDPAHQAMVRQQFTPYCYEHPLCDQRQKYRSPCGACNNLEAPLLGKAFTPFRRIVPSAYDDGMYMSSCIHLRVTIM